jgi:hypothetical protein
MLFIDYGANKNKDLTASLKWMAEMNGLFCKLD